LPRSAWVRGHDKADIEKFLKTHALSYPVAQIDVMEPPKDFDAPKGLPNTYISRPTPRRESVSRSGHVKDSTT